MGVRRDWKGTRAGKSEGVWGPSTSHARVESSFLFSAYAQSAHPTEPLLSAHLRCDGVLVHRIPPPPRFNYRGALFLLTSHLIVSILYSSRHLTPQNSPFPALPPLFSIFPAFANSGGSDWVTIHVISVDQASGAATKLSDELIHAKFSSLAWTHDHKGFFYHRYPAPNAKELGTEVDSNQNKQMWCVGGASLGGCGHVKGWVGAVWRAQMKWTHFFGPQLRCTGARVASAHMPRSAEKKSTRPRSVRRNNTQKSCIPLCTRKT